MAGKIHAISISKRKGIPKSNIDSANLIYEHGIENDVHAGKWHRQVSLLAVESIDKMRVKLPNLRAGAFAENITTEGINLSKLTVGDKIKIGDSAELEITQLGKVCHDKCAIFFRVGDCVMPTEGIFARVVKSGSIKINDNIAAL
ncbi:MAG TPA: MOSC domain-containing protein [Ignavibacteria bacterium]|nr:MOSC domain-containing protein [Ignavibacteria bacterium]